MKRILLTIAAAGIGWWGSGAAAFAQQELPREPLPVVGDPRAAVELEPLTRGPVHEAFAQAVTPPAEPGLIIGREPPPMIDEIPPAQRPAAEDVAWIPGYWGWDDDRKDFIWISGIWRAAPPNREWVPGYWARVTDGYQWISGYWRDIRVEEVEYLPPPPETVDAGPTTESPTGNEIWVPGCWIWQQNKYAWRPGYWGEGNPRWIWTNSHYVYTTRGYIFVNGYWDFLVPQRGVLFAPVYFNGPVPQTYVYSPRLVVNTYALVDHLFLRPTYRHYYFGDYYGATYRGRGILPYFVFHNSRYGFDSLYSFHRWQHRNDRNWAQQLQVRYDDLRDREDGRPPRDYAAWQKWHKTHSQDLDHTPFITGSLQDFGRLKGNTWRFSDLNDDVRRSVGQSWRNLDQYRRDRIRIESERAARTGDAERGADRVRVLKPTITGDVGRPGVVDRDDRPGRDDRTGRDDRPGADKRPGFDRSDLPGGRNDRDADVPPVLDRTPNTPRIAPGGGPANSRESDGSTPKRETPRTSRDLPGPLNDIRNPAPDTPNNVPRPDRDRDGKAGVTSPRTLPSGDDDLPNKGPAKAPPGLDRGPRNTPRVDNPTPRETPNVDRNPRDVPKAGPAPRDVPKAGPAPRANPQPKPQNDRPGAARPGNSGGDRPGNAGGNRGNDGRGDRGKGEGKGKRD